MFRIRTLAAAALVGGLFVAQPVSAQETCSDTDECSVTNSVELSIPALVKLEMATSATTLTPPTVSDLGGSVANAGPTFTVHANRSWTLSIKSNEATNWAYVGSFSGVKPIGDLSWSSAVDGTFASITNVDATLASGAAATDDTAAAVFFETAYSADYSSATVRQGAYSLPVVFTLSAP